MTFLSFGDFIVAHHVAREMVRTGDPLHPFRGIEPLLRSVDFSFANLESPLDKKRGSIEQETAGIIEFDFRVLNLANNHAMDRAREGLWYTIDELAKRGVATTGAGRDLDEAWKPAIVEHEGIRIAFLGASYTSVNSSRLLLNPYVARIDQRRRLRLAVATAKNEADFVVVAMHAGIEYTSWPSAEQQLFAQAAIRHGADVVIGSHPHVLQPIRHYRGKPIFHSLGNFIFDQRRPPAVKLTAAVRTELRRDGDRLVSAITVIPIINDDITTPRVAQGEDAIRILRRMGLDGPEVD